MVLGMLTVVLGNQFLMPGPDPNAPIHSPVSPEQFWYGYFLPPARVFEFVLGMLLARIMLAGRAPRLGILPSAGLVVPAYLAGLYLPEIYSFNLATVVPLGLLRSRSMQWLGDVSYAFYLCQGIVLLYGRTLFDSQQYSTPVAVAVLLGFLTANLLAAWLLYATVERPMTRRWSRSRRRPAAEPGPVAPAEAQVSTSGGAHRH
jgi:peptidoglycan/LPS O-acetylase OafA/YrhL